jgi:hypothetical protein
MSTDHGTRGQSPRRRIRTGSARKRDTSTVERGRRAWDTFRIQRLTHRLWRDAPDEGQQIHLAALRHNFRSCVEAIVEELHLDRSIDAETRRPEAPRTWARAHKEVRDPRSSPSDEALDVPFAERGLTPRSVAQIKRRRPRPQFTVMRRPVTRPVTCASVLPALSNWSIVNVPV